MGDYIDRKFVLLKLHELGGCDADPDTWADGYDKAIDAAYNLVRDLPAPDIAPVRRTRFKDYACVKCSWFATDSYNYKFCPGRGAKVVN